MVLLSGPAISQTSPTRNDSSVISNKDLRKAALLIEQGKRCLSEVKLMQRESDLLNERIALKDSTISSLELSRVYLQQQINNYKLITGTYQREVEIKDQLIKQATNKFKKQRRKTFFVGLIGILATGTVTYLLINK